MGASHLLTITCDIPTTVTFDRYLATQRRLGTCSRCPCPPATEGIFAAALRMRRRLTRLGITRTFPTTLDLPERPSVRSTTTKVHTMEGARTARTGTCRTMASSPSFATCKRGETRASRRHQFSRSMEMRVSHRTSSPSVLFRSARTFNAVSDRLTHIYIHIHIYIYICTVL